MPSCWSCQAATEPVSAPRCPSCQRLQPLPPDPDPFLLLGVPMTLEVDRDAVDAAFRQRSREVHPDRLARADPRERRLAAERTASLNTAYAALRSVETRAAWLLRRAGVQVERTTDPDLLNDVMELRERALEDPGPVRQLAQAARTRALDRVVAAYRTLEGAGTALDPRALEPLARDLNAARYYARLLDDLSGSGRASP